MEDQYALIKAAMSGNQKLVRQLLDHGVDVNARDELGNTPLMLAILYGENAKVLQDLLNAKDLDTTATDAFGNTILMLAVLSGADKNVLRRILSIGTGDIRTKNKLGGSALTLAVAKKNIDAVRLLAKHPDIGPAQLSDAIRALYDGRLHTSEDRKKILEIYKILKKTSTRQQAQIVSSLLTLAARTPNKKTIPSKN